MMEPPDLSDTLVSYFHEVAGGRITSVRRTGSDLRVGAYDMGADRLRGGSGWITFEDAEEIESVDDRAPQAECTLQKGMIIIDLEYVAGKAWLKANTETAHDLNSSTHSIRCRSVQVHRTGLRAALRRLFGGGRG